MSDEFDRLAGQVDRGETLIDEFARVHELCRLGLDRATNEAELLALQPLLDRLDELTGLMETLTGELFADVIETDLKATTEGDQDE